MHEFDRDVRFEQTFRGVPSGARPGLFGWFRRWKDRPRRVFWELDVDTGEWKEI